MDALEVKDLTVNYEKTAVLWDVNFTLPENQLVGILGPNGAGKSTLLKALLGVVQPLSGEVLFFGKPLEKVRSQVGYVPQRSSVDWDFPITAFDLVLMGRYGKMGLLKWASSKDKEATWEALAQVEMTSFAKRQIGQLSGGQQQRLFLARALVQNADIYLLDEPFAGVDTTTEKALISIFDTMKKAKKTLLIVHHNLGTADNYFDWMVLLNTCLIAAGPTKEIFTPENIARTYGRNTVLLDETLSKTQ
jgi:manganese/zinc/iron transport system ATP- binding protein